MDVSNAEKLAQGRDVLEREALYLDEREWDKWLALFTSNCEYWVPAWKADGTLASDPQTELSHIYYSDRRGLEDRVVRIRSRSSPASNPAPRTSHIIGMVRANGPMTRQEIGLRTSWATHVFFPVSRQSHAYFGRSEYLLVAEGAQWLIARKKVILQNDYIPTMLDVYCL
jgi:3-phenylpropionate/cinnamic acid dioxygenase small subunit